MRPDPAHPEPPPPAGPPRPARHARPVCPVGVGVAAGATLLLAALVSIAGIRHTARNAIDQEVRGNLARLAQAVAATIDADAHARLTDPAQEDTDHYRNLNDALTRVIDQTEGLRFAYTLRPVHGTLRFVLDGSPVGDADNDGVEDHSFLMDEYHDPDPAAWDALMTEGAAVTVRPYTDRWGTYLSGFAPVRVGDRVDAVVGVDVSASDYHARLDRVDRAACWAILPGAAISLLAGLAAWRLLDRVQRHGDELEAHRERAVRANRAKSDLLANISHELRTPLTAIMGFTEIALDDRVEDAERAEAAGTVRHSADHLLTLINGLLDMSKAEAGAIVIEPTAVDLTELVRTAVAPLRLRADAKGLAFDVVGVETMPRRAMLDPTRTRQILLNLLGNAVKFTDQGRVVLRTACHGGMLRFVVEDTGPGMDHEQVGRLFQPFSQVCGSVAKRREGTGLGLAISRHLAELMGGHIRVESVPGRGSRFEVAIPFRPAEPDDAPSPRLTSPHARGPLAGRRVLLAEDGPDNRQLLRFILTRAGAEVEEHPDGRSALDAMHRRTEPVDLVLTDWDMPVLDGAGLVRGLRASGWRGPVISLTAHAMPEQAEACAAAGCDAHLTKPIDWGLLIDTCARLIDDTARRAA